MATDAKSRWSQVHSDAKMGLLVTNDLEDLEGNDDVSEVGYINRKSYTLSEKLLPRFFQRQVPITDAHFQRF